ncbi:MAG: hypothetical protein ABI921_05100, partial [Panacibacter sp.]
MKKLMPLILLCCFHIAHAQTITARVIDGSNNKPLGYAIVLYHNQQNVVYTDAGGYFSIHADSLLKNDLLTVQFLGFQKFSIAAKDLKDGLLIKMIPDMQSLQPVIVSNCRKTTTYELNKKKGRIKQYIGPGPETKLVIISRYDNISGRVGYIN